MSALLTIENITGGYTESNILNHVSLEVLKGEIVVIIGPNGAGKSTVMRAVFGLLPLRGGRILLEGHNIAGLSPDQVVRQGVSYVPQVKNIFSTLTVQENLEMGAFLSKSSPRHIFEKIYELFPPLKEKAKTQAGMLSGGQRQMVAFGKALMLEPKLLLLDEPTAGLSPLYVSEIFRQVKHIHREGLGILMVEQNAKQALAMADRAYVLAQGENKQEGTGRELLEDAEIAQLFLGG